MFGAPVAASSPVNHSPEPVKEAEEDENDAAVGTNGNHLNSNPLLSDKVNTSFLPSFVIFSIQLQL